MAVAAREITVPDEPGAWKRLGFAVGEDGAFPVGGVRIRTGAAAFELGVEGLAAERPDGLAIVVSGGGDTGAATHPNGASVVDHVVAFTDDRARTVAALEAAGLDLRRMRDTPAPMAFLRAGSLVLEVVETGSCGLWGFVVVVPDVAGLGSLVGAPRDAVQPGRRIATVRREAGLGVALAFMTPRPG